MYIKYLRYLIKHKWYVGQECFRRGLYWRGISHDWSKFLPSEFVPYARYFYGEYPSINDVHGDRRNSIAIFNESVEIEFDRAWLMHQHRNPHHWQHHILREDSGNTKVLPMPHDDLYEMLCDWVGAGRSINNVFDETDRFKETRVWYLKNRDNIMLHPATRRIVERELNV